MTQPKRKVDILIIGAGHNGLVSAIILARQGLNVLILEEKPVIGGACRTEKPFKTAPNLGTSELVQEVFPLHPQKIEQHFGITRGHIHHIDNSFGFSDRLPYTTPISGLYSASAGCHPAGSVIGAAGYNAAQTVLQMKSNCNG